jgi:hypothetical protein
MRLDCFVQELQHRTALQTQRLHLLSGKRKGMPRCRHSIRLDIEGILPARNRSKPLAHPIGLRTRQ